MGFFSALGSAVTTVGSQVFATGGRVFNSVGGKIGWALSGFESMNRYDPAVLISGDGTFNKDVERHLELSGVKGRIATVSVIGPQSSGKSTLLNVCFSTTFEEMDSTQGWRRTTQGVAVAKYPFRNGIENIIILDVEGTDGAERATEGTDSFERKTTLFALAMSNVVIINIKSDNINRHHAASVPLLEAVLQALVRKFNPPRHAYLLFAVRDNYGIPVSTLKESLEQQMTKIWDRISCPQGTTEKPAMKSYLTIEVFAMSNYMAYKREFKREAVHLRDRIFSLIKDSQPFPATCLIDLAETTWTAIQKDEVLNIQSNEVKVAEIRCSDIKEEIIKNFGELEVWVTVQSGIESGRLSVIGMFRIVGSEIGSCESRYDEQTQCLEESVRNEYRKRLLEQLEKVAQDKYSSVVQKMSGELMDNTMVMWGAMDAKNLEAQEEHELKAAISDLIKEARQQPKNWRTYDGQIETLKANFLKLAELVRVLLSHVKKASGDWLRTIWEKLKHVLYALVMTGVNMLPESISLPVKAFTQARAPLTYSAKHVNDKALEASLHSIEQNIKSILDFTNG